MKTVVLLEQGLAYGSGKAWEFQNGRGDIKKPFPNTEYGHSSHPCQLKHGGRAVQDISKPASFYSVLNELGVYYIG